MENQFEKILDILIVIAVFFIFTIMYYTQRQETLIEQVLSTQTSNFLDNVNSHGKLTKSMYEDYISKIDDTNVICNVKLEHKKLALEPEYRLRTAQEIIDEQDKAYNGDNTYHYFPISTELPVVDDNTDNSGLTMNTETNESILAKSMRSAADPTHSHTNGCYVGAHDHGTNILISDHTHTDDCYCPGYINTTVTYDRGGRPIYTCKCTHCHKEYTYGTFTEGQRCKQLYCGFTNGQNCNCYEPVIDAYIRSSNIELYCHTCGKLLYTIINMPWGPAISVTVGREGQAITYNGQSYCTEFSAFENYLMSLQNAGDAETIGCPHKIIPSGTILNITGIGQCTGCFICNDYYLRSTSSGTDTYGNYYETISLYCMKCNKLIAQFCTGSSYKAYLYQNGVCDKTITGAVAEDLYIKFNQMLYGNKGTVSIAGASKVYHENGESVEIEEGSWSNPYYTTFSADADILNTSELKTYINHGCTYNAGANTYCGMQGELKCHDIVISITPTNPVQTVYIGEPLITTALATYMDGSTGVVLCNADFTAAAPVKNKTVTLSYVNIKRKTLTCTETVTVIPKTKVCVNGHTYNLNADGTDPGCPYCKAWLKSLEIFNPTDGKITIYRGTTLKENGVVLLATYFDGRKEYVETNYIDNLDKYYVGIQNVTISYKGKDVTLIVTVKRNIVQCPVCHHYYELYPDDTDPGCPYCKARTPIFTGNVLKYYSETYSDEILKELYEGSGTYYFKAGDYFSIIVSNKAETLGTKVLELVIHGIPKTTIHVEYGGTVREDAEGE